MEKCVDLNQLPKTAHPQLENGPLVGKRASRGHDTRVLQAYLGHRNIQHTVRHTELSPTRFKKTFGGIEAFLNRGLWPTTAVSWRRAV